MARQSWILTVFCTLVLSVSAFGQAAPEPVINHIPAGSMGYVIVPSLQGMTDKVDKLIADLGFAQALSMPDPEDSEKMIQMSVLDMLRGQFQLGEGFNPQGGLAAVMLNVKDYDIDIMQLMSGVPGPEDGPKEEPKLPFVLFIPGKSVQSVLGNYNPQASGKYMTVTLPFGPMVAGQAGSYVMLSPNAKALDAVLSATKKASSELPAEQLKAITTSQIAMVQNFKVCGPMLMQMMQMAEAQMTQQADEMAPLVATYFRIYREILSQIEMTTTAGRIVDGGLVFEQMASFQDDSPYAKALASEKVGGDAGFGAVPNLPYVLAISGAQTKSMQSMQIDTDLINSLLMSEPLSEMPDDLKASIKKLVTGMNEQITGMQMVGGGPKDDGVFGLSMVLKCKDSSKTKELFAEYAKLIHGVIQHYGKDEPDAKDVTVKYVKGIETVGGISADAIVITSPKMNEMSENDRKQMKGVLGEDQFRFRVASTDENTVVLTVGGAGSFFAEAVKAAKTSSGTIAKDQYAAAALKHLPAKRSAVVLFNAANLFDLIKAGQAKLAPDSPEIPFSITTKIPVAMGAGKSGKSAHAVVFVPTGLIKEIVGIAMTQTAGMGGPGAAPPMGDSDF